jgi:hypothetical protein
MTKILVPPGIGDGYWVFVKLRGFLEAHGIVMPEVWVHDASPAGRAAGFWNRVPFVRFQGSGKLPKRDRHAQLAYRPPGIAVQRRVAHWDYFLSFNGSLEHGTSLDQALPGAPANWYEPLTRPESHSAVVESFQARFGRYVACAFWEHGFYRHWLEQFGEDRIVETLRLLADEGYTPVLMGAAWDQGGVVSRIADADPRFVSLVGETDFDQLTALLEGADGVLGFPAGNSLLGPYFRRPTVLLWHEHFKREMWRNVCPPGPHYQTVHTEGATPRGVADALFALMEVVA